MFISDVILRVSMRMSNIALSSVETFDKIFKIPDQISDTEQHPEGTSMDSDFGFIMVVYVSKLILHKTIIK